MTDITKCNSENCPLKDKCWRALAPSNPYWQSYSNFEYDWEKGKEQEYKNGNKVCSDFYK